VIKDSADRIGRSYPLLIIGTGPLNGWEEQWDLVPFACEKSWSQMERLAASTFEGFREFDGEVHRLRAPSALWSEFVKERAILDNPEFTTAPRISDQALQDLEAWERPDQSTLFLPLRFAPSDDQLSVISAWHSLMKKRFRQAPKTVFMGGTAEMAYLVVFHRPLGSTDFVKLWTVSSAERGQNGPLGTR
jgi:type VI secretion system protein VasJ